MCRLGVITFHNLAHEFGGGDGAAQTCRKLSASLLNFGNHSPTARLSQPALQDGDQFLLFFRR
jgi:hypothetical protein